MADNSINARVLPKLKKIKGKKMLEKTCENQNFDFDIGYLVKSPCKNCDSRPRFPECMDNCEILDQIQTALSESMSCANNFSAAETYDLPLNVLEQL
jgi:hypothetical protein